ncbi:MAG TPA: cupin domain-containing protein [Rubricoccaceae bacterium]|jgi:mannose-6-phosphate isomerase-like protein (cupin superfamily)
MRISLSDALAGLPLPSTKKWPDGVCDVEAFRHGTMSLVLYTPEGTDHQTPHGQDELYVVEGSGVIEVEGEPFPFAVGDALFVPAGREHRFVEFTPGLKVWAVFWGPKGGERVG